MLTKKSILSGAGVCLHVTALPGEYGIGELGNSAKRFILNLEAIGMSVWQVLPLGPTGYGDSPYQLLSTFAGNELLLDIDTIFQAGWLRVEEFDRLKNFPHDHVDFANLIPAKMHVLHAAAGRFRAAAPQAQLDEYHAFVAERDAAWLHDYACFRVLKNRFGQRAWTEWPDEYRRRDAQALAALVAEAGAEIDDFKVLQFWFHKQWTAVRAFARKHSVRILGDLPFYIAFDSADAWARPDLLKLDANLEPLEIAGCPPDYYSEDGQLWGNPVYDWAAHEAENYAWWVLRVRHALEQADALRLDHFKGFESYWSVPAGETTARNGEWIEGPGAKLFRVLEREIGDLPLLAEDLGVITPAVDELREEFGLPGMKVLHFELADPDYDIASITDDYVCYTGTHDNDTTRGWIEGGKPGERDPLEVERTRNLVLGRVGGTTDEAHVAILRHALATKACCVIAPMQDLLGLDSSARFNLPGTTQGNWQWRLWPDMLSGSMSMQVIDLLREKDRLAPSRDL
jgi:4-alpha-glucanotransferase